MKEISFVYRNHRGEVETRRVIPERLQFILRPGFDYQPGWFLVAWDLDRQHGRTFALSHIIIEGSLTHGPDGNILYELFDEE